MRRLNDSSRTAGFTLVELLVVIGIIGILLALTANAVQSARESARRLECTNKVKQLTLASIMFHDVHRSLPEGQQSYGRRQPNRTWLSQILPYLEQQQIANEIEYGYEQSKMPFASPFHPHFSTPLASFACPSDSRATSTHLSRGYVVALTSYVGMAGITAFDKRGSLFVDSRTRFSSVTDGLSNTILVGERPASPDMYIGWWYAGISNPLVGGYDTTIGAAGPNPFSPEHLGGICDQPIYPFQPSRLQDWCGALHFWSLHNNGANFGLLDGSVRFFAYTEPDVIQQMGTIAGNDPLP